MSENRGREDVKRSRINHGKGKISKNRGREDVKRSRGNHGKWKISENRGREDAKRNRIDSRKDKKVIYSTTKTAQVGAKTKEIRIALRKDSKQVTIEKIKVKLIYGEYQEIEQICRNQTEAEIRDLMMNVAYDTENLSVYGFIQYMIRRTKNANWIKLAVDIMLNPFSFMEGAYSVALYHARELILMERNIKNLERLLFFYNIPEKLINDEEAKNIAEEILKTDANNKVAQDIIKL